MECGRFVTTEFHIGSWAKAEVLKLWLTYSMLKTGCITEVCTCLIKHVYLDCSQQT